MRNPIVCICDYLINRMERRDAATTFRFVRRRMLETRSPVIVMDCETADGKSIKLVIKIVTGRDHAQEDDE